MESNETEFPTTGHGQPPPSPGELPEFSADVSVPEIAPRRFYTASLLGLFAAYQPLRGSRSNRDPGENESV